MPVRRSNRLLGYDYSQSGHYFITICSRNYQCLFSTIPNTKYVGAGLAPAFFMGVSQWWDLHFTPARCSGRAICVEFVARIEVR